MADRAAAVPRLPEASPQAPSRTAKIVLVGSASTGKTSIRNRYFKKTFSQAYIATIGADFVSKKVQLDDGSGESINVQLWDTAGQERFQALGAAFYRGADACILVYSVDSRPSYKALRSWYDSFVDRCPVPSNPPNSNFDTTVDEDEEDVKRERRMFPFICLGNKVDLRQRTSIKQEDLVEEQEVADLLEELCPVEDLRADVNVKKRSQSEGQRQDLQPSALPIESDTRAAQRQQEEELRGTPDVAAPSSSPSQSTHRKRRGSSQSSIQLRSITVLPDPSRSSTLGGHHKSGLIGKRLPTSASIYHTPSASINENLSQTTHAEEESTDPTDPRQDTDEGVRQELCLDGIEAASSEAKDIEDDVERGLPTPDLYEDNEPPLPLHRLEVGAGVAQSSGLPEDLQDGTFRNQEQDLEFDGSLDGIKHFHTSARTGEGIEEAMTYLVNRIARRWKFQESAYGSRASNGGLDYGLRPQNINSGGPNDSIKVGSKSGDVNERKGWRAGCC